MIIDTNAVIVTAGAVSAAFAGIAAYFAKRADSTATAVQKNGVTHIVAQVVAATPATPLKTIVVDGVSYTEVKTV